MYYSDRHDINVPIRHNTVRIEEIEMHLGDLLPPHVNYVQDSNVTLRVRVHYIDPDGRERNKVLNFPATSLA